jgi:C4-dicarboxylate-specific signal transduction histidine kinase
VCLFDRHSGASDATRVEARRSQVGTPRYGPWRAQLGPKNKIERRSQRPSKLRAAADRIAEGAKLATLSVCSLIIPQERTQEGILIKSQ